MTSYQNNSDELKWLGKYRIPSARHPEWDYASDGEYFVTICTKNRIYHFGDVINEKMILNDIGKIACQFWLEIPKHFSNVILDEWIVMPNHLHGIIVICNEIDEIDGEYPQMSKISPKPGSLSVIIGSFKSICKKTINKKYPDINFAWQSRFYDRIIRDEQELYNIHNYIRNNPIKWDQDRNNPENLWM